MRVNTMRAVCALVGLVFLVGGATPAPPDVDALAFARAFRAGDADRYKGSLVSGIGTSFHGTLTERIGDGTTRRSLVVTLGAAASDGQMVVLKTWDDFVAAERARTTLVVALSGPDLPSVSLQPTGLRFSGVYDGQVRTIMRVPQAGDSATSDGGPCPGEQGPQPDVKASFHCAALLTGATASIVPQ